MGMEESDYDRDLHGDQADTYDFKATPVDPNYNAAARTEDRRRDIYGSKRVSRPAYTRPDPPCTVCGLYRADPYPAGHERAGEYPHDCVTSRPVEPTALADGTGADDEAFETTRHWGDHPYNGTVRIENVVPGRDKVTFPIMRKNAIARMGEDDLEADNGALWSLQKMIADAKFELLKLCVNAGEHMVSDITAEVVVEVTARTLTDKAGPITKVKDHVDRISILVPNGDFKFGDF